MLIATSSFTLMSCLFLGGEFSGGGEGGGGVIMQGFERSFRMDAQTRWGVRVRMRGAGVCVEGVGWGYETWRGR